MQSREYFIPLLFNSSLDPIFRSCLPPARYPITRLRPCSPLVYHVGISLLHSPCRLSETGAPINARCCETVPRIALASCFLRACPQALHALERQLLRGGVCPADPDGAISWPFWCYSALPLHLTALASCVSTSLPLPAVRMRRGGHKRELSAGIRTLVKYVTYALTERGSWKSEQVASYIHGLNLCRDPPPTSFER